jgi:hypothetical protein
MLLTIYLCISYTLGLLVQLSVYAQEGQLTVKDLLMYMTAPFSMVPIVLIHLLSHIFDLDKVIVRK